MTWKNRLDALAKTAKEHTGKAMDGFIESQWPLIEAKFLELSAKLPEEVRSGARNAGIEVKKFMEETARPSALDVLKHDASFAFLADLIHDALPNAIKRRVRVQHIVKFCFNQRQRLINLLESKQMSGSDIL